MSATAIDAAPTFFDGDRPAAPVAARRLASLGIAVVVAMSMLGLLITGRVEFGAAPLVVGLAGLLLWALPGRIPLLFVIAMAMLADVTTPVPIPETDPMMRGFSAVRLLLLENLSKGTGIAALRVSGMEVALAVIACVLLLRALLGTRVDARPNAAPLMPLVAVLGLTMITVLSLEAWGLARGGDARQSFWQLRYLLWTPLLAGLCMYYLRRSVHLVELATIITAVAWIKVAAGLYIYVWSRVHGHGQPHSVTSHADTMLFSVVIALWMAVMLFRPSGPRALVAIPTVLWMLLGIVINNRRTAYVSVFVLMLLLVLLLPRATRRAVLLTVLASMPLVMAYLFVGRSRSGGFFAPAAAIWSVSKQDDSSSDSRDVENYNLTLTLNNHFLLGTGFGHEYELGPSSYDLSESFAQYRYIAHNSVLWLMGIGGVVGFAFLWLQYAVGVFFAALAHRRATLSIDRIAGYVAIATFAAFQLQAWADMGTQGWTGSSLVALAFAATAIVVQRTGAWPTGVSLIRRTRSLHAVRAVS